MFLLIITAKHSLRAPWPQGRSSSQPGRCVRMQHRRGLITRQGSKVCTHRSRGKRTADGVVQAHFGAVILDDKVKASVGGRRGRRVVRAVGQSEMLALATETCRHTDENIVYRGSVMRMERVKLTLAQSFVFHNGEALFATLCGRRGHRVVQVVSQGDASACKTGAC